MFQRDLRPNPLRKAFQKKNQTKRTELEDAEARFQDLLGDFLNRAASEMETSLRESAEGSELGNAAARPEDTWE